MIKNELLKFPKLRATSHMMQLAAEDKPIKLNIYSQVDRIIYQRWGYTRCCIKNGMLKLAIFFTEPMRMGGTLPAYEIYLDRTKKKYLTYDCQHEKWITASFCRLNFPNYAYCAGNLYFAERLWVGKETNKTLQKYFRSDINGIKNIIRFQDEVLKENLEQRHKKQTDPWDKDLEQTPKLPKDWTQWVSKVGVPEHYIFYTYTKKKKNQSGYCTHCEKMVPIKNPKYNKKGACPCCRATVTYKSIGKCGTVRTSNTSAYLLQRCKDGAMLREFIASRTHKRNEYTVPIVYWNEVRRVIYDKNGTPQRAYCYDNYKNVEYRWIADSIHINYYYNYYEGKLYGKTLPTLAKRELKTTGIAEYYRCKSAIDPEAFLFFVSKYPYLEKLSKVGLTTLFDEQIKANWKYNYKADMDETQTKLTKMLHIDAQQLKQLRDYNGGTIFLQWLQYEKLSGKIIPDQILSWMSKMHIKPKDLEFIQKQMSIKQIYNYIKRKMKEEGMQAQEVITTWADYLTLAKRLNLNTNDEIIYRVRKLQQRHDELVKISMFQNDVQHAGEILEKYPNLEQILSELKPKYEFCDEEYTIVVPQRIEEIILEGRALQHCVANERYFERIAANESYIMFLRKTADPDQAYYTLEVEPGGAIRQKRTMFSRQNEDIEKATQFLRKWQLEISKRMAEKDREIAEKSKTARLDEFAQLDKMNVVINTGPLQGQRLVDVLMNDFMGTA